jgi:chromosome segregation ATPase
MSRLPTLLLGTVLLSGVAWMAVSIDEIPRADVTNTAIAQLFGSSTGDVNYVAAMFSVVCLLLAAGVGIGIGWSLRSVAALGRETELQRRLNDTKGRIPRLESGMRNKEMHVARVEQQMQNLEGMLPPLQKTIDERDLALRDRDRMLSLLKGELAVLKGTPMVDDNNASGMTTLELDADGYSPPQSDARNEALEKRLHELEAKVREREARIAELMHQQGNHETRIPQLESALDGQRKRSEDFDRERQRQDKWLDVLNDQLARARETNDRLAVELQDREALQQRIVRLEVEVKRLGDEIADRERRLAASRFECATARTTITHLQAQLGKPKAASGAK